MANNNTHAQINNRMLNYSTFTLLEKYATIHDIIGNDYVRPRQRGLFIFKMAIVNLTLSGADTAQLFALAEKNVRFVAAKTLTRTAQAAQTEIKKHLRETFVLRKPNFYNSIKVRPATKQDLRASIYTMAGFAALQQTGGKQKALSGRLAVPQYKDLRELLPGRDSSPPGSFLIRTESGSHLIAARENNEIRILYYLKHLTIMPKRLNMLEIGTEVAVQQIPVLFRTHISQID